ncbi:MAG: hypothetical protein V4702_01520 [Patescibacteria group bacterium]
MSAKKKISWVEGIFESGAIVMALIFIPFVYWKTKNLKAIAATAIALLLLGIWGAWRFRSGKDGLA